MKKVLYFEGAGCVHGYGDSDIENCRIRTAFTNNQGKKIYLELTSSEKTRYNKNFERFKDKPYGYCAAFIDFCHFVTNDKDDCNESRLEFERNYSFHYTKVDLLQFINEKLNCSFDEVVILNELTDYQVHSRTNTSGRGFDKYNYGDEFQYDEEKTKKRLAKRDELKKYFEQFMKYDNSSYWVEENTGNLVVRINTCAEVFKKMKFKERQFVIEIF